MLCDTCISKLAEAQTTGTAIQMRRFATTILDAAKAQARSDGYNEAMKRINDVAIMQAAPVSEMAMALLDDNTRLREALTEAVRVLENAGARDTARHCAKALKP